MSIQSISIKLVIGESGMKSKRCHFESADAARFSDGVSQSCNGPCAG